MYFDHFIFPYTCPNQIVCPICKEKLNLFQTHAFDRSLDVYWINDNSKLMLTKGVIENEEKWGPSEKYQEWLNGIDAKADSVTINDDIIIWSECFSCESFSEFELIFINGELMKIKELK